MTQNSGGPSPLGKVAIGLVIIGAAFSLLTGERAPPAIKTDAERAADARKADLDFARRACENFVKKTLHDPKSAEFDDPSRFWAEQDKRGIFHVQATLRARNGFNALRQTIIECTIGQDKHGDFYALSLEQIR